MVDLVHRIAPSRHASAIQNACHEEWHAWRCVQSVSLVSSELFTAQLILNAVPQTRARLRCVVFVVRRGGTQYSPRATHWTSHPAVGAALCQKCWCARVVVVVWVWVFYVGSKIRVQLDLVLWMIRLKLSRAPSTVRSDAFMLYSILVFDK